MSEANKENNASQDIENKIREVGDPLVVNYLSKFKPEDGKKVASGSHIVAAIELLHSNMEGEKIPDGKILDHPFLKSLVKDGDVDFSGDELTIIAIKSGVDVPDALRNEAVTNALDKSDAPEARSQSHKDKVERQSQTDHVARKAAEELAKEQLGANPDYREKQRKQLEEKIGRPVSDEELLKYEKEKVLKNLLSAQKEAGLNDKNPANMAQQGVAQAIGSGIGGLFRGLKEGAKNSAKAMDNWVRYQQPAKKIMAKEADELMHNIDSKVDAVNSGLDVLSSNKNNQGERLSTKDKKDIQKDVLQKIDECKVDLQKCEDLADNPALPKKSRLKLHEKANEMRQFSERLDLHPEGSSKIDKEFKSQLKEQAKSIAKMVKNIMDTIKSFFQRKGNVKQNDHELGVSL